MAIKSLIIHRITRWQEDKPADLSLRDSACTVTADYEALLTQTKKLFNAKPGKKYGCFHEDYAEHPFGNWLQNHLDEKITFSKLSIDVVTLFKQHLDEESLEADGYLLFVIESLADGDIFYVFYLENSSGMEINSQLELTTHDYLNTSKLDLAARIELNDWQSEHGSNNYFTLLLSRSYGPLGEIFTKTFGFSSSIDTDKETNILLEALQQYSKLSEPEAAKESQKKAYEYCAEQHQLGQSVQLDDLSCFMDEKNPVQFSTFAKEKQPELAEKQTIHADHRKLKQLVRLSGKGKGVSISFSSDLLGQLVHYDHEKDSLILTDIPKTLKQQLAKLAEEKNS